MIAALFCPVNESVWEHLKLLAAPFLLLSAVEYAVSKKKSPNFFAAKALALWAGMAVIVFGFYTYTGVLGQDWLPADIALFVAGAAAAWLCSHRRDGKGPGAGRHRPCRRLLFCVHLRAAKDSAVSRSPNGNLRHSATLKRAERSDPPLRRRAGA
mgnify:CR=1 FL=1